MSSQYYEPEYKSSIKSVINIRKGKIEKHGIYNSGKINDRYELTYITEGDFQLFINGNLFNLGPNDLFVKKPYDFYNIVLEKSSYARFILINFKSDDDTLSDVGGKVFKLDTEHQFMINELYELFNSNFNNSYWQIEPKSPQNHIGEKICFLKFESFLLSLLLNEKRNLDEFIPHNASAMNFNRINEIMNENIEKKLAVSEIAKLCNMSTANVKKTVAQYANCGVIKHFTRMKISKAINYLKSGSSVAETCNYLGFSSQSYFTQVFRKETKKLPRDYLHNTHHK